MSIILYRHKNKKETVINMVI